MKYLKKYETITNVVNSFGKWTNKRLLDREKEKTYIKNCLYNFLQFKNIDLYYISDFILLNELISVYYDNTIGRSVYKIKGDEYSEFLLYLNDPEMYTNSKKFNI
jgi:hypothetical protein